MQEKNEQLKRKIGVLGLSSNLINIMIGAGIFALPAIVAAGLGAASIFAYLFCGLLIGLVMLCFAEVGSKITTSGGAYTYITSSFGPYFGFLTAVLFILSTSTGDAAIANIMIDIIGSIFPFFKSQTVKILIFFILFGVLGYINVKGVKEGMALVKIITITKLVPLLLLVFFSWGEVSFDNLEIHATPSLTEFGKTSLLLFFAFVGAESGLSISGEVKNPKKNIPKAIFISIVGVLMLYMLLQTVSQGVLGGLLPTLKENPLSEVAKQVFGPIGFTIIVVGAAISIFGTLTSAVLSMPRVLFQASKDNVLPFKSLGKIHNKFSTPYIAVMVYAVMGFLFASFGGFQQLAVISSATILLVYLGVSLAVIKLRRNTGDLNIKTDGFKLPGGYLIPILSTLTILWLLSHLTQNEVFGFGIFILVLTVLYFLKDKFREKIKHK
ncbi:APC family permease [Maribacter sp. ACAM166]|uniref:APC family permease n=1 Tax=Maribacter sp. ACAM166 TaxID=2508996 RepID=UPI0010FD8001|nr:APC family permease [Maribacter sp. ACAM166]TLP80248.1 amino acid permease [Maribacter sp. ACAM166]